MSFEFRPMRSLIFVDCVREEYRHRLQHWLYNTHIPDSISKFTPYCVKYAFYNALPVPPGGERFGTRRMQMTEHYWLINEMLPLVRLCRRKCCAGRACCPIRTKRSRKWPI